MAGNKKIIVNLSGNSENGTASINIDKNNHSGNLNEFSVEEMSSIVSALGDIVYRWDLKTGQIEYSDNIYLLSEYINIEDIRQEKGFNVYLDVDNFTDRNQTVRHSRAHDEGQGVNYELDYKLKEAGRSQKGYWIEDKGKWFADSKGRPEIAVGIMRIVDKRHDELQKLALLGTHDALTGLVNRIHLSEKLSQCMSSAKVTGQPLSFLLVGIDNLALINEAFGLSVADEILCMVAQRISKRLRRTDLIGRYSGNKFGVILTTCEEDDIQVAAKRLTDAVGNKVFKTKAGAVNVTISVGGIFVPKCSNVAADIMQFSEETLAYAKAQSFDSFMLYKPSVKRENMRKKNIDVANEIISALNDGRVSAVFQPIVHTATGVLESYECLMRINDHEGQPISLEDVIEVAERVNLMWLLDSRILQIALKVLAKNKQVNLSVNISAASVNNINWLEILTAGIGNNHDMGKRLTIEITETCLLADGKGTAEFIDKIHALGCLVSIDDFGTGYTSFTNLKQLDIDIIKIDGSFISNMRNNADDRFFVKTMYDLAKHFKVKTVAEWVEHEDDVTFLAKLGVDYLQGFYFAAGQQELLEPNQNNGQTILGERFIKNISNKKIILNDNDAKFAS